MATPLDPSLDFLVQKNDWKTTRFDEAPAPAELEPGRVLFRVDRFALTANNITYALAGDSLGYWRFFPAPDGWGRIPVMGFGDVVRSTHAGVAEGTRCFGFFPMSRYLVIEPSRVSREQIVDGAAHRAGLAPTYSQYMPVDGRSDVLGRTRGRAHAGARPLPHLVPDRGLPRPARLRGRARGADLERVQQDVDRAGLPGAARGPREGDRADLRAQPRFRRRASATTIRCSRTTR